MILFFRIPVSQVRRVDLHWKPASERVARSQVSCTTSSAAVAPTRSTANRYSAGVWAR